MQKSAQSSLTLEYLDQLYTYLVANRTIMDVGGRPAVVFVGDSEFTKSYGTAIADLKQRQWVKGHQNPNIIILGDVVQSIVLWGKESSKEDQINYYLSRYSSNERNLIETVFTLIGTSGKRKGMTLSQRLIELKYYHTYSISVVISSVTTYLGLPSTQQYGEQYLRGIIRKSTESSTANPIPTNIPSAVKIVPKASVNSDKQQWVKERLAEHKDINSLTFEEMSNLASQLEDEYERTFSRSGN